jgi:ubiquinone/menaquinone biosynthesis C-methylase UbiE
MSTNDRYIPALSVDWLTPLFDPVLKWILPEERFKQDLVRRAAIETGHRILDLGCGTGTLTILIKQHQPKSLVVGLDGDPHILEIARAKARQAKSDLSLVESMAFQLPHPDSTFDRVISSLVFHHLTTRNKQRALYEVHRVLRPGGELYILDFGAPHTAVAYMISLVTRRLEEVLDNVLGLLPVMLQRAGFSQVEAIAHYMTVIGTLTIYKAQKAAAPCTLV